MQKLLVLILAVMMGIPSAGKAEMPSESNPFIALAKEGKLSRIRKLIKQQEDAVKKAEEDFQKSLRKNLAEAFVAAAESGQLMVVEDLGQERFFPIFPYSLWNTTEGMKGMELEIKAGKTTAMAENLKHRGLQAAYALAYRALLAAAQNDHVEVVTYFLKPYKYEGGLTSPWTHATYLIAYGECFKPEDLQNVFNQAGEQVKAYIKDLVVQSQKQKKNKDYRLIKQLNVTE